MLFRDYKETVSQMALQVLLSLLNYVHLPASVYESTQPAPVCSLCSSVLTRADIERLCDTDARNQLA